MIKFFIIIFSLLLMGFSEYPMESDAEVRAEQARIKEYIRQSQLVNKRPSPTGSPRAARVARNRYRNQSDPIYPKTIYIEVLPVRRSTRFSGGIPR